MVTISTLSNDHVCDVSSHADVVDALFSVFEFDLAAKGVAAQRPF
jgi:hypothetical protein